MADQPASIEPAPAPAAHSGNPLHHLGMPEPDRRAWRGSDSLALLIALSLALAAAILLVLPMWPCPVCSSTGEMFLSDRTLEDGTPYEVIK